MSTQQNLFPNTERNPNDSLTSHPSPLTFQDEDSLTPHLSPFIPDCTKCKKLKFVSCNSTMPCICHQIKIGNGIYNRADGSIIVGTYIVPGCLMHSKEPFDNLSERIRKLSSRGSEITLTIKDPY